MKINTITPEANIHPLIGAEVVFTKHSEKNKRNTHAQLWVTFGKAYTVVGYSDYPEKGDGPQIVSDSGSTGDAPMADLDYDIISRTATQHGKPFQQVFITLESQEEVAYMRDMFGESHGLVGEAVYESLNEMCGY